jgi:hypothetical protein
VFLITLPDGSRQDGRPAEGANETADRRRAEMVNEV